MDQGKKKVRMLGIQNHIKSFVLCFESKPWTVLSGAEKRAHLYMDHYLHGYNEIIARDTTFSILISHKFQIFHKSSLHTKLMLLKGTDNVLGEWSLSINVCRAAFN